MTKFSLPLAFVALIGLTGCGGPGTSGGPAGIPGGSSLVDERPEGVSFKATASGTLYLRDAAADRVVLETRVEEGQTFATRGATVTLDGKPLPIKDLRPGGGYQLFFRPAKQREYHPAYNP